MELEKIIHAAKKGGEVIKKYFGQNLESTQKSVASNFVTKADLESEAAILKTLSTNFPDYNILSEENGFEDKKSKYTFVVDPLDGTFNFYLGIPDFSVSIALLENDKTISAVVYNPILNKVYSAILGKGAFLEDTKLQVNQIDSLITSSVVYTGEYQPKDGELIKLLKEKESKGQFKRVLENWSPSLDFCLLASGKIEAIINNSAEVYDYMAGKLIAKEAGAKITDFKGKTDLNDKNGYFIATNGTKIHEEVIKIISDKI